MRVTASKGQDSHGTGRIRVAIIDDHPAIREALTHVIGNKIDLMVCGEASSAADALALLRCVDTDVAVVDVSLSDVHGFELVHAIRAEHPHVQVVVFSMYDERVFAERAVRAGALGYVTKGESTQKVVDAIRCASEHEVYLSWAMLTHIVGGKTPNKSPGAPGFAIDELTDRERALFQLMGEGCTINQIATALHIRVKTAETYRRRTKEKLGLESVSHLLQYALHWSRS